jgi:OFA family oxalate/formate antiporter-like MFS transporter
VFAGTVASGLVVSIGWSAWFALGAGLLALSGVAMALIRLIASDSTAGEP